MQARSLNVRVSYNAAREYNIVLGRAARQAFAEKQGLHTQAETLEHADVHVTQPDTMV